MPAVRVRRAKHATGDRPRFWRIEQDTDWNCMRVFIYKSHYLAMRNADKIARYRPISTYGLRGFHIEETGQ